MEHGRYLIWGGSREENIGRVQGWDAFFKSSLRDGEMAQQLRALVDLLEEPCLVSPILSWSALPITLAPEDLMSSSGLWGHCTHKDAYKYTYT